MGVRVLAAGGVKFCSGLQSSVCKALVLVKDFRAVYNDFNWRCIHLWCGLKSCLSN